MIKLEVENNSYFCKPFFRRLSKQRWQKKETEFRLF